MEIKNINRNTWVVVSNKQTTIELDVDGLENSFIEMVFGNDKETTLNLKENEQFNRHIQGYDLTIIGANYENVFFSDGSHINWCDMTSWETLSILDGFIFAMEQEIFNN